MHEALVAGQGHPAEEGGDGKIDVSAKEIDDGFSFFPGRTWLVLRYAEGRGLPCEGRAECQVICVRHEKKIDGVFQGKK